MTWPSCAPGYEANVHRLLRPLVDKAPLLGAPVEAGSDQGFVFVDVDDTIIKVHGHVNQGSGYGYSGVRGLNALLATASTDTAARRADCFFVRTRLSTGTSP